MHRKYWTDRTRRKKKRCSIDWIRILSSEISFQRSGTRFLSDILVSGRDEKEKKKKHRTRKREVSPEVASAAFEVFWWFFLVIESN